jgi:hypothetical protein
LNFVWATIFMRGTGKHAQCPLYQVAHLQFILEKRLNHRGTEKGEKSMAFDATIPVVCPAMIASASVRTGGSCHGSAPDGPWPPPLVMRDHHGGEVDVRVVHPREAGVDRAAVGVIHKFHMIRPRHCRSW